MRNDSGMNEELEYLTYSPEYADFIMKNCGGERIICNGDSLTDAMEDRYLWEEFLAKRNTQIELQKKVNQSFDAFMAEQMAKPEYINSEG